MLWLARRYLTERAEELWREYDEAGRRGTPRYTLASDIRTEIERLDPDHLPSLGTVAASLVDAAAKAGENPRTFAAKVHEWLSQPQLTTDPLPYRRVLTPAESRDWRAEVQRRWGVSRDGCWHPMLTPDVPADVLVLDESMWDGEGAAEVRRLLRDMGRTRVIELREYGADYLLDLDDFTPAYTGAEGVWTDAHHDWLVYASHEWSVAFGGVLADRLRCRPGAAICQWRFWTP
ncbi:hypothetical protein Ade02nite_81060 [Paractinoplanes deccanensis]|uniref:DUF4253 domain-containing protein n=1 Tax=Paractinoplanes deccanensis TaxID=113561 RepID=A0ABQ3YHR3_9ACTN|nr:hypothetical protein Ade02nite_81060 [Actinoplanes deccanensis]